MNDTDNKILKFLKYPNDKVMKAIKGTLEGEMLELKL